MFLYSVSPNIDNTKIGDIFNCIVFESPTMNQFYKINCRWNNKA